MEDDDYEDIGSVDEGAIGASFEEIVEGLFPVVDGFPVLLG